MQLNRWFRKHQKKMFAFIAVVCMIAWLVATPLLRWLERGSVTGGAIFGEEVSGKEFVETKHRLIGLTDALGQLPSRDLWDGFAWKHLIFLREAERLGLQVTDNEVQNLLSTEFGFGQLDGAGEERHRSVLARSQLTHADFKEMLGERLLINKLWGLVDSNVKMSDGEAWLLYAEQNEQVKARYAAVEADAIADLVQVGGEEARQYYEQYKDVPFGEGANGVGYKEPEKVKIEYVMATFEKYAKAAEVKPEEVEEYYEKNKQEFLVKPEENEAEKTEEPAESMSAEAAETEPAETTESESAETAEGETEEQPEEKASQYRPLEEVAEEIEKKLRDHKAHEAVDEVVTKIWRRIGRELDIPVGSTESLIVDFKKLAEEFGVEYHMTDYFGPVETMAILPGASELNERAFQQTQSDIGYPRPAMETSKGTFIFQLLDIRPARAAEYEAVKERVIEDVRKDKAFEKAVALATSAADGRSFDDAVAFLKDEIRKLEGDKAGAALPAEAGDEEKPELIKVGESKLFARPVKWGPEKFQFSTGVPGRNRAEFAEAAFKLDLHQIGVAVEAQSPRAAYVLEPIERKPAHSGEFQERKDEILKNFLRLKKQEHHKAWMAGLQRRANPTEGARKALLAHPDWAENLSTSD